MLHDGVFYADLQEKVTSVVSVGQFTYTGAKCRSVEEARQSAAALAVSKMTAHTILKYFSFFCRTVGFLLLTCEMLHGISLKISTAIVSTDFKSNFVCIM